MNTYTCPRCKQTKPTTEFHRDKSTPMGHTYKCKDCRNKANKLYKRSSGAVKSHSLYWCYKALKSRCYYANNPSYKHYGARGIKVCDRWLESFWNFLADMGEKPTPSHQIDRIDNDGDYCPENCRWATPAENCRNRTTTKLTMELVRYIRHQFYIEKKNCFRISKEFDVSDATVREVVDGGIWKDA